MAAHSTKWATGTRYSRQFMNIVIRYTNANTEVEKSVLGESGIRSEIAQSLPAKNGDYTFDHQDDFGVYAQEMAVVKSKSLSMPRKYGLRVYPGASTTSPVARAVTLQDSVYSSLREHGVPGAATGDNGISFSMRYQWCGVVVEARTWQAKFSGFVLEIVVGKCPVYPEVRYSSNWANGSRVYDDGSYSGNIAPDPDVLVRDFLCAYREVMSGFNPTGFIRDV